MKLREAARLSTIERVEVGFVPWIEIEEGGTSWTLALSSEAVVAGRGAGSAIVLSDAAASREHLVIEPRGGDWWVRDLGSRNGTRVNGKAVPNALLRPGDRIEIGAAALTFLDGAAPDAARGARRDGLAGDDLARDLETGLGTMPWLHRELRALVARDEKVATIVKLDVDSLGLVNDVLGYRAGDEAIRAVAHEVRAAFEEHARGALLAREAGGKLVALVPGAAAEHVRAAVESARERVAALPVEGPLLETNLTVSAGVAAAPQDAPLGPELLRKAEAALAAAKRAGRDRVARPPEREASEPDPRGTARRGRGGRSGVLGALGAGDAEQELGPLLISKRGQRALALVAEALASDLGVDELLELLLASALRETDARRGFVVLDEGGALVLAASADQKHPGARASGATLSHGILRAVLRSREALLVEDVTRDVRFKRRPSVMESGARSVLAAPIARGDSVLGVIYLEQDDPAKAFDREARDLVRAFARLLVGPIRRGALQRRTSDDLARARLVLARTSELDAKRRARFAGILGRSAAVEQLLRSLERLADHSLPVLIRGESGTGKELVARGIHASSGRAKGPFVAENCAAFSETLLEVELFGCKKGAFTGAERDRIGLFEAASGGTLFLDEVGEMSPALQAKLLRVLEEKKVRRVGENAPRDVDVRIVAATHRDLARMVALGSFRQDLYYRLAVLTVETPPLRARRDDVPLLAEHFLAKAARDAQRPAPVLSREALEVLVKHEWPGNVRELENELKKVVALGVDPVLPEHLSAGVGASAGARPAEAREEAVPREIAALLVESVERGKTLHEVMDAAAKETVLRLLEVCRGNRSEVARRLGVSRPGLRKMFQRFGLE